MSQLTPDGPLPPFRKGDLNTENLNAILFEPEGETDTTIRPARPESLQTGPRPKPTPPPAPPEAKPEG